MPDNHANEPAKQRQGIQSIEVGTRLLRALAAQGRPMMLRDIAQQGNMSAAKARRYLISFMRMGLVEQKGLSGRYDLGEFALELGLASLARLDPVRLAGPILDDLCERTGETVALAMWGNHGATCVRWVEAGGPITVTLRTGVVLPLTASATGLAFAAFYRSPYLKRMLDAEIESSAAARQVDKAGLFGELGERLAEIRQQGLSRASGSMMPGINGFSAPVFDHSGHMVAAVTSLGVIGKFDFDWHSPTAQCTRDAAATLSQRLGFGSAEPGPSARTMAGD